jgi:hypothetical protein
VGAPEKLSIFCRTTLNCWTGMFILSFMSSATGKDYGASGPAIRSKGRPVGVSTVEDAVRCVSFSWHTTAAKLAWWNGFLSNEN